jgi:hypothetical protein
VWDEVLEKRKQKKRQKRLEKRKREREEERQLADVPPIDPNDPFAHFDDAFKIRRM